MSIISHDPSAHRFTTEVDGRRAQLDYALTGRVMTITHTRVPPEIGGRGIAAELMSAGLEFGERLAAGPTQAFAIMKRNLEFADVATYQQSLDREAFSIAVNGVTGENADAIQAFLDKREPDFRG